MNSRNPFGNGFEGPLRFQNKHWWLPFLDKAKEYLANLQAADRVFLYHTKCKTPILGYLIMIESVTFLCEKLVEQNNAPLKYILNYKFSHNYLELFFSAVRALNGRNNNPTFTQFKVAYRRLLNIHNSTIVSGNCTAQANTVISPTTLEAYNNEHDKPVSRKYNFLKMMLDTSNNDYCSYSPSYCYSTFIATIVTYIAEFVVKKQIDNSPRL